MLLRLLHGTQPAFESPLPVGQLYFPAWERYEVAMRGIFDREYYINNGPLSQELEAQLRDILGVRHAICTGNATFGLMMVVDALGIRGRVLMPSFSFIATAQSVAWCGASPVFCDIDPSTHQICPDRAAEHLATCPSIEAIMAVNLWGGAADVDALERLARAHGIPLIFDSAHAFGCAVGGRLVGGFGAAEVFSFHATKVLSAAEGGCVTTNDDDLAARLRGIRPSYDAGPSVEPYRVLNSRMSEAQAAVALLNLEDYPENRLHNQRLHEAYRRNLAGISGLRVLEPSNVTQSNYQYLVCEVDEATFGLSRDELLQVLEAENVIARRYFYPGIHRSSGFETVTAGETQCLSVTERMCNVLLQLPLGGRLEFSDVERIAEIISSARVHADDLSQRFRI